MFNTAQFVERHRRAGSLEFGRLAHEVTPGGFSDALGGEVWNPT